MNHIKFIIDLFPKASEGWGEPEGLGDAFMYLSIYLENNITTLDEKEVIRKLKKIDYYFKNMPTQKNEFDIYTDYVVGFVEELIASELRFLIPHIETKANFVRNKDYFLRCVGKDNYEKTLEFYN